MECHVMNEYTVVWINVLKQIIFLSVHHTERRDHKKPTANKPIITQVSAIVWSHLLKVIDLFTD